jgi:hypothetical protein
MNSGGPVLSKLRGYDKAVLTWDCEWALAKLVWHLLLLYFVLECRGPHFGPLFASPRRMLEQHGQLLHTAWTIHDMNVTRRLYDLYLLMNLIYA